MLNSNLPQDDLAMIRGMEKILAESVQPEPVEAIQNVDKFGWLQRRADRVYSSFDDMIPALKARDAIAETKTVENAAIELIANPNPTTKDEMNELAVKIGDTVTGFNHHSFGQLARLAKAPADYLRSLPAELVKDNLEFTLRYVREVEDVKTYADGSQLRAVTGPGYGRVNDSEVAEAVRNIVSDGRWTPADQHMGFRATDRSMNLFLIDKANPIVVGRSPRGDDDVIYRGLRVQNSEVGLSSLTVEGFLFRSYCLNGMIFGMQDAEKISIRHSKNAPFRWAREVQPAIEQYAATDGQRLVEAVENVKAKTVARDDEAMISFLRNRKLSAAQARAAIDRVEVEEHARARTAWHAVQGITALARDSQHVEERAELERVAGTIWQKAA